MSLALPVALLLCGAVPPEVVAAPGDAVPRRQVLLTAAPVGTLALAAASVAQRTYLSLWLPVGVSLPVDDRLAIDIDLGLAAMHNDIQDRWGWSASLSVGPTWSWGDRPHAGFFVGPRVLFQISRSAGGAGIAAGSGSGPVDLGPDISRAFLAGVELGYLFRFGDVVLGLIVGGSLGYAFDQHDPVVTPFRMDERRPGRPDTWAWALNLNLLRVGLAL